jgi:hypothetical protein
VLALQKKTNYTYLLRKRKHKHAFSLGLVLVTATLLAGCGINHNQPRLPTLIWHPWPTVHWPGSTTPAPILPEATTAAPAITPATAAAAATTLTMNTKASACENSTLSTISSVDAAVADNIYATELRGSFTAYDIHNVEASKALAAAVAADDATATKQAVVSLVYRPQWHIVRLRVFNASGQLLSDIGGPYVIAPVSASIRYQGKVVGHFLISTQDDVGFTKLESRTVGDPIGVYVGGRLAVDTKRTGQVITTELGGKFPTAEPLGSTMVLGGRTYSVLTRTYSAFPSGTLQAVIAVPFPLPSQRLQSCAAVQVGELQRIADRLSLQFRPLSAHYNSFVGVSYIFVGVREIIRQGLSVLGTSLGSGPAVIPESGSITYRGRKWWVVSSAPSASTRLYILVPVSPTTSTGLSGGTTVSSQQTARNTV